MQKHGMSYKKNKKGRKKMNNKACKNNIQKCICQDYNVKCVLEIWKEDGKISEFVYEHLTLEVGE